MSPATPTPWSEAGSYPGRAVRHPRPANLQPLRRHAGRLVHRPHRIAIPTTGEHHAICYEAQNPHQIRHVVIAADGKVTRELPITVRHGPCIHDCGLTARYVVILDLPVTFSMKAHIGGHGFPYRWNPDHQARIGLLPRAGAESDIIWCDVDPAYIFHVANAHDRPDGAVVLDVCAYQTMFNGTPKGPDARCRGLERWTINPTTRSVMVHTLDSDPQEFPRPDERFLGQQYRYIYSIALPEQDSGSVIEASALYRHDLHANTRQVHDFGPGSRPGEFVFTPRAPNAAEGDGWLIGLVINADAQTTDLVILDAMAFNAAPVARIHLPHRVPPGFHGNWLASSKATA